MKNFSVQKNWCIYFDQTVILLVNSLISIAARFNCRIKMPNQHQEL
jgi:hypothetical protein